MGMLRGFIHSQFLKYWDKLDVQCLAGIFIPSEGGELFTQKRIKKEIEEENVLFLACLKQLRWAPAVVRTSIFLLF